MCPMCLAAGGLYVAGGVSAGAVTTFLATKWLGKRKETVMKDASPSLPATVDRATFQAELDALRVREKAHTREGDAIAAARRRLPMVEVDANLALIGPNGPLTLLEAFEGRRQLIAYYFMWHTGRPAPEQCEGCTWVHHAGCGAFLPAFPRHHLRGLLSGALRRKRPLPRRSWAGRCRGTRCCRPSTRSSSGAKSA